MKLIGNRGNNYRMNLSRVIQTVSTIFLIVKTFFMNLFSTKKWYIIEGNIGCGKTTLIRNLKQSGDYEVIEEPVDEWKKMTDENGENILGLFYKDGKRYAYLFQTIVFKSRIRSLEKPQEKAIRFSERSIWTDKYIFSKNCHEMGLLNTVEKTTYDYWFHWLESKMTRMPDGIIYLQASPETCHERMKKRDRQEETSVPLEYLTKIHEKHEEWLNVSNTYKNIPIYVIDNSVKPEDGLAKVLSVLEGENTFDMLKMIKVFLLYQYYFWMNRKEFFDQTIEKEYKKIDVCTKFLLYNIVYLNIPIFLYTYVL